MKRIASYLIALATMAFTFTSCEDVPSPFGEIVKPSGEEKVVIDPAGSGTEKDPYNVAAVLEVCSGLASGTQTDKDVYVKGIVSEIKDIDTSGTYGNATYWISDDADGKANKFYIYRGFGLGGKKFNEGATPVKVGDKIVIKSPVMNYNGTYETVQNKCIIVELNGVKDSGSGGGDTPSGTDIGSKDAPITCAKALELIKALADGGESDGKAFVKGKVIKVTTNQENFEKYGNLNYLISDDGSEANAITVYSGDGLNGEKFKGITDLAAGDEVIVYGKLYKYVNKSGQMTPEINKGNYLVSLVKGSGGGGDTPSPGSPQGTGTQNDPFNVAAAIAKCQETGQTATAEEYYVKGIVNADCTIADDNYKNATFDMVDVADAAEKFKAFRVLAPNGQKLKAGYKIPKGATVIVCGKLVNYKGNTPETVQTTDPAYNGTLVSVNGQAPEVDGQGGGEQSGDDQGGGGTVSGNDITVDFSSLGFTNQEKLSKVTLSDGTTLTFDAGTNKNGPAYYTTGTAVRMYPENTMVINAGSKKIAAIEIGCDEYNGTLYNASGDIVVDGNKMTIDGNNLKYTGPNSSSATVSNTSSTTGAPSQLRMKTLKITYAK